LCHWPKKLDTNSLQALYAHYKELVKRALRSNIGSNAIDSIANENEETEIECVMTWRSRASSKRYSFINVFRFTKLHVDQRVTELLEH